LRNAVHVHVAAKFLKKINELMSITIGPVAWVDLAERNLSFAENATGD
jgi:hypothetical protein